MSAHDPAVRTLIATVAAHESWANTPDRAARLAPAHKAAADRFVKQARERFPHLPDAELAIRAESLRKAHFARMALKSSLARRARKARRPEGASSP